jgi:antitoxin HicB
MKAGASRVHYSPHSGSLLPPLGFIAPPLFWVKLREYLAGAPGIDERHQRGGDVTGGCRERLGRSIIGESMSAMTEYRYTVLFEPAEEGGFVATCPALPGLVTEGDTLEEARQMAHDAIRGYLESLHKDGQPIPIDRPPLKEEVLVTLPESA